MNNYIISDIKTGTRYTRITKAAALKKYASGETIALCACKMRPGWPWFPEYCLNVSNNTEGATFESICDSFIWYNCTPATGKYIAFYSIQEENV